MTSFAIAVIAYGDYPELIKRCLASIVERSKVERQLIVCLNKPSVETSEVVRQFNFRNNIDTLIVTEKNIGIEGSLTLALHACREKALLRLDDDSWIVKDGWDDILQAEIDVLPDRWGALGRLHRFGAWTDGPPCQGYISRPWVRTRCWYNPRHADILEQKKNGISGGFSVLNTKACIDVGYPDDSSPVYEEDGIMSVMLQMGGYSIHNSDLISTQAKGADCRIPCDDPYIAIGDFPSRTNRLCQRPKWKGEYTMDDLDPK